MDLKKLNRVMQSPSMHWVGDGFPVASIISPSRPDTQISPFLMLDYGGPFQFGPADKPRGVDSHPHRGFETVTLVFEGELEHRDSAGHRGAIGPGDVQWMTAASGVLHEEKHSRAFTQRGGAFEVAQFWVNLPSRAKMSPPAYQELTCSRIAVHQLDAGAGSVRVIAGDFAASGASVQAAARTVTPLILWDITLKAGHQLTLPVPAGFTFAAFVREGELEIQGTKVPRRCMAIFDESGQNVHLRATTDTTLLAFGGEPIREPVVSYGPFVMNTSEEIHQAVEDFRSGRFGRL